MMPYPASGEKFEEIVKHPLKFFHPTVKKRSVSFWHIENDGSAQSDSEAETGHTSTRPELLRNKSNAHRLWRSRDNRKGKTPLFLSKPQTNTTRPTRPPHHRPLLPRQVQHASSDQHLPIHPPQPLANGRLLALLGRILPHSTSIHMGLSHLGSKRLLLLAAFRPSLRVLKVQRRSGQRQRYHGVYWCYGVRDRECVPHDRGGE